MEETASKSPNGSNDIENKLENGKTMFPGSKNQNFKPITELWNSKEPVDASMIAKECLSCDRWAGTTVIGGGIYLLYNTRKAPSIPSKLMMATVGSIMVVGGAYQGWIQNLFSVRFRIFQDSNFNHHYSALYLTTDVFVLTRNIVDGLPSNTRRRSALASHKAQIKCFDNNIEKSTLASVVYKSVLEFLERAISSTTVRRSKRPFTGGQKLFYFSPRCQLGYCL